MVGWNNGGIGNRESRKTVASFPSIPDSRYAPNTLRSSRISLHVRSGSVSPRWAIAWRREWMPAATSRASSRARTERSLGSTSPQTVRSGVARRAQAAELLQQVQAIALRGGRRRPRRGAYASPSGSAAGSPPPAPPRRGRGRNPRRRCGASPRGRVAGGRAGSRSRCASPTPAAEHVQQIRLLVLRQLPDRARPRCGCRRCRSRSPAR